MYQGRHLGNKMATQVTVWQDTRGGYHDTQRAAQKADLTYTIAGAISTVEPAQSLRIAEVIIANYNAIKDAIQNAGL